MRIRKWKEWMSWKSSYIIWLMLLRGFLEDPQRQEANGTILFPLIDINTCVRKSTYQHINLPLVLRPCWSIFLGDWPYCELLCLTTSICFFFGNGIPWYYFDLGLISIFDARYSISCYEGKTCRRTSSIKKKNTISTMLSTKKKKENLKIFI